MIAAVVLALICAGGLLFFFWWQLRASTSLLSIIPEQFGVRDAIAPFISTPIVDPHDQGLWHLRQGDLLALDGAWQEARDQYQRSADADGGLPALRKLALAQLIVRDVSGAKKTLNAMQKRGARAHDIALLQARILLYSGEIDAAKALLLSADDSPQRSYGLALITLAQGLHDQTKAYLQDTTTGWDPQLRSSARVLQAAYDEFDLFPESTDVHLVTLLSRALAEVQECEIALPLLMQVTTLETQYRDAWIVQGYCQLQTLRPQQALTSLQSAYALDPQKPEIQYFLARAYSAVNDYRNAMTYYEYALINGFSDPVEVQLLLAQAAMDAGQPQAALVQYQNLLNQGHSSLSIYQGMVQAQLGLGQIEQALASAKDAVEFYASDAESHVLHAMVLQTMQRLEEARAALQTALEINPYFQQAQELLRSF